MVFCYNFLKKEAIIIYVYSRIRDLREDNDLKQSEIAEILKIGVTTYRRYEVGEREIPFHLVILLAQYYNVSIDYLAGLTNKTQKEWKSKNNIKIKGTINNSGNITIK